MPPARNIYPRPGRPGLLPLIVAIALVVLAHLGIWWMEIPHFSALIGIPVALTVPLVGLPAAVGWGIDSLLGSLPLFLIVFGILGFVAGVKTMLRSAQEIQEKKLAEEAKERNEGA